MKVVIDGYTVLCDDEDRHVFNLDLVRIWMNQGYPYVVFRGQGNRLVHRYLVRARRGQIVDHKDRNTLNNKKINLRKTTRAKNSYNTVSRRGKSEYKGVSHHKGTGRWQAGIGYKGKRLHIGLFDNERDAALAYDVHARKLFGEFANTNF